MDHRIRMGLMVAWGLFLLVIIIWWIRRTSSRHYPFSERATVILDAIRNGIDVGIIYWSKSEGRFIRRVVTPESLDGYSMRGRDHTTGATRIFKVTRIRIIQPIPEGASKRPPSRIAMVNPVTVAVVGLGAVGLGLLAFALFRTPGPQAMTDLISPPFPTQNTEPSAAVSQTDSNRLKLSEPPAESPPPTVSQPLPGDVSVNLAAKEQAPVDDFMNPPVPVKKFESWYLVVEQHPSYKINQVASVLQAVLRYRPDRAIELEQSVRALGRAVVWSGPKQRAENLRELLEGYDLIVSIERSGSDPGATNTTAVVTNQPATTQP